MSWARRGLGVLAAVAALASCGGGSGTAHGPASKACEPLADDPQPIAFGKILGVGSTVEGALVVIDELPTDQMRLFFSDGRVLQRQPVAGSGSGALPSGGTFVVVTSGSGDAAINVEIVTDAGGTVAMGVVKGALSTKTFTIGIGETLTVLGPDALAGYALQNLPGTITVEYLATLADGRTIVVTHPEVDWDYPDFRLFLSTSATSPLLERKVISAGRGIFTVITFDLDGKQAQAHFGDDPLRSSNLAVGADTFELSVMPPGTRPTGLTFLCL